MGDDCPGGGGVFVQGVIVRGGECPGGDCPRTIVDMSWCDRDITLYTISGTGHQQLMETIFVFLRPYLSLMAHHKKTKRIHHSIILGQLKRCLYLMMN